MKTIITLLTILLCASCMAQRPQGMYYDETSGCFACICQDSISISHMRTPSGKFLVYYYGNYTLEQGKMLLFKNNLRYENYIIEELYTDFSGIEIQLYEKHPFLAFGAPTKVDSTYAQLSNHFKVYFEYDSLYRKAFFDRSNTNAIITDNGLLQIPMESLSVNEENIVEFFILGCANFFSEVIISAKPHTRYVIKQKSLYHRPMVPQEVPIVYDPMKNQIEITESGSVNDQPPITYQLRYIGPSDACFGEFRKRFPDL